MPLLDREDCALVVVVPPSAWPGATRPWPPCATGRGTLLLVGFETDTCVAQSAIGLLDLGFAVVAVEDAMATMGLIEHERGPRRMVAAGAGRNDVKGVTYELVRLVDEALALVRALRERHGH